jgi:sirohydrochlorin ferrochelatase
MTVSDLWRRVVVPAPRPGLRPGLGTAPIVIVAHGSRDPRSADTMRAVGDAVRRQWSEPVLTAFLDFDSPSVPGALRGLVGAGSNPIVVPALLTRAYHGRVDLPEVLASVPVRTVVTPVLGPAEPGDRPDPLLIDGLVRRLSELDIAHDGLVLLAAGTSHEPARSTVEAVAALLSMALHVPCVVGYASASAPSGAEAVALVRSRGARRVVAASYFLAAGRLYDAAAASARDGGALGVAEPLGAGPELVDLVLRRAIEASGRSA